MSLASSRILFTLRTRSRYFIAQTTGMSWGTVNRIAKGLTLPAPRYAAAVRNMYQRNAYNTLCVSGVSSVQARRFSWYSPKAAGNVITVMDKKVDFLSKGWMGIQAEKRGLTFEELNTPEMWEMAREQIREGLRHSIKTYEEWELYGR